MSQVYPWDRGTNYTVEMGREVAGMIVDDIRSGNVRTSSVHIPEAQ